MELLGGYGLLGIAFFLYILYRLYRYSISTYTFWADRNVPFTPPVPFFGNVLERIFTKVSIIESQQDTYNFFEGHKYGGRYTFRTPTWFLKDPELIEQVLIKDFSTFYNRSINRDPNISPLSRNLITLQNSQWKTLRNKLTPAFSSSKMKFLHQEMLGCCDNLAVHLDKYSETGEPLDVKKTMSRFVVYAIGSIAFGLKLDTLNDPDCEFGKMGEAVTTPSVFTGLLGILRLQFPRLAGYLERAVNRVIKFIGAHKEYGKFLMNVVKDTADYREKNKVERNDFLQIMMELRKQDMDSDDELKFDLETMTASSFVFLLAGYDTTAGTISFMLYELAAHQDVQERLLQEILAVLKKYDGLPTYEAVKEMKYLDQVMSETLRMYPPIPSTFRVSRNDYQIPDTSIVLPAGTTVSIPIYSLQRDPKYFPDPDEFNPDRFSDPSQIQKGTYIPFGDGPRICIGMRLAKLQMKLAIIKMLLRHKFTVNDKTQTPIKYKKNSFFLRPIGGLWLNVSRRT